MRVFVSDTFTAANGTVLFLHPPDVGALWSKNGGRNVDFEIQSNACVVTSLKNTDLIFTNLQLAGTLNYDVKMDVTIAVGDESNRGNGLVAYYLDNNNFYYGWYKEQSTTFELHKRIVNGADTLLDSLTENIDDGTFEFKLKLTSTPTQKFDLDSVEKLSATDADLTVSGKVGMIARRVDVDQTRDNFVAETTAAPVATNAIMQAMHTWWNKA